VKTKEIFQNALQHYSGTIVLVSHDRFFLDQLVQRVFEIRDGALHEYTGNYTYFVQKRENEIAAAESQANIQGANDVQDPPGPAASKGAFKSRDQRRLEAEDRNRRGKLKAELLRELPGLEMEIAELEGLKKRDQFLLCDPEVLNESKRIKPLMQELNTATTRLGELYRRWEELTREMEKIDKTDL
jgi:ATP-binding cassette subfamily F protein 3